MPSNKKQQRGQKIDASQFFVDTNKDQDLEWAHAKNYDEQPSSFSSNNNNNKSPSSPNNTIQGTKAAKFGNFRDDGPRKVAGGTVPEDMQAPFVAFVKTFGRQMTEESMAGFFPDSQIDHMILINCEKALFCFIEFNSRDDLGRALLVSGAKMKYQYPCTVDVASASQIEKFVSDKVKKQQQADRRLRRQAGSASRNASRYTPKLTMPMSMMDDATSAENCDGGSSCCSSSATANATPINFDRNAIFGTQKVAAPLVENHNVNDDAHKNNNNRNITNKTSSVVNFDQGRSFFNSATPVSAGDLQKLNNNNNNNNTAQSSQATSKAVFASSNSTRNNTGFGSRFQHKNKNNSGNISDTASSCASSSSCSKFSEFSRSEIFCGAGADESPQTSSPNPSNKPQFNFGNRPGSNNHQKNHRNNHNPNNQHFMINKASCESLSGGVAPSSSSSSAISSPLVSVTKKKTANDNHKKNINQNNTTTTKTNIDISRDALFGNAVVVAATTDEEEKQQSQNKTHCCDQRGVPPPPPPSLGEHHQQHQHQHLKQNSRFVSSSDRFGSLHRNSHENNGVTNVTTTTTLSSKNWRS